MIGHAGVSSDQWGEMSIADEAETDGGNGSAQYHWIIVRGTLYTSKKRLARGRLDLTRILFVFLIPCMSCQQIGSRKKN